MAGSLTSIESSWTTVHRALGVSLIDHLFNSFDAIYLNRWRGQFSSDVQVHSWKLVWVGAFEEDGLTPEDVKRGLSACRKSGNGWPPTLPEFLAMCRPVADVDPGLAYVEAIEQLRRRYMDGSDKWSHPAIYWTAIRIGDFDLRNSTWQTIEKRWTAALKDELAKGGWADVPAPRVALPAPGQTFPSREEAAARVAEIKARFGLSPIKRIPGSEVSA